MMAPFCNESVQAAEDNEGWRTGRLCSGWRINSAQLLYQRNSFFDFVDTLVTGIGIREGIVLGGRKNLP